MEKIKYFIECNIPVYTCNFKCEYCYLGHHSHPYGKGIKPFIKDAEYIADYFSVNRLGGIGYFNCCGFGETLIHPEVIQLVDKLTIQGHYAGIVTNGVLSSKFEEIVNGFNDFQKKHLFIKFSFHYLELKKRNLLNIFVSNVEKVKTSGISYTIEITPHDELIPFIDEVKKFSLEKFGALPHVSIARNEWTENIEILTKLDKEKYKEVWSVFNSKLFEFKYSIFNQKRCEFCYAGLWSLELELSKGNYSQCYKGDVLGNITEKDKKVNFRAIGKCRQPHCFNGHSFLTYGVIPEFETPTHIELRDRVCTDGSHWVQRELREFFSTKLSGGHTPYTEQKKIRCLKRNKFFTSFNFILRKKYEIKQRLEKNKN